MASIGAIVFNRLTANSTIKNAVKGNIMPEYRDKALPALVYELTIQDTNDRYEGTGAINYELTISVVAEKYQTAVEIADSIIAYLDYTDWTDAQYSVIGCFIRDRDEYYDAIDNTKKRLAVVDLLFDFIVTTAS